MFLRCIYVFPLLSLLWILSGCMPNYFLLHPLKQVPGIYRESGFFDEEGLRVHWLARYPDRQEPLPAVLVHPDRGSIAEDMEGICLALAERGYFAVAAHYQRLEKLEEENPLIPWRSGKDAVAALDHLRNHPRIDPKRIGLLGFSKGAILSLQIASESPAIQAVVAYYPLADFEEWVDVEQYRFPKSLLFRWVRNKLVKEIGATDYEEARSKFRKISPINLVERIQAPVLLIHGEKDHTFPVEQTQRLCQGLKEAKKSCKLMIVPEVGHVFNFLDAEQGRIAWAQTVAFFERHLFPKSSP